MGQQFAPILVRILAGTVGLTPMFFGMLAGGTWNLERENNLLDGSLPFYRTYKTRDDRFVAIGALIVWRVRARLQRVVVCVRTRPWESPWGHPWAAPCHHRARRQVAPC